MSGAGILFVVVGALAIVAGLGMLTVALKSGVGTRPRNTILLIAGMMATAFGLILGGFALAYNAAAPLDLNTAEAGR